MAEQHAHSYLRTHQMSGDLLRFGLNGEADGLLAQAGSSPQGRASKTLVREGPLRLTVVAMRRGVELDDHYAPGPSTVYVFRGSFRLTAGPGTVELGPGDIVSMDAEEMHTVEALEDGAMLLTVIVPPGERASGQGRQ